MLKVLLYDGGMKLAGKSGVGRAMEHQARALQNAGIPYTHDPGEDYNIVQLNTVFPDSLWMGLKARMQGKKVVITGTPPWRISGSSFTGSNLAGRLFKRGLNGVMKAVM